MNKRTKIINATIGIRYPGGTEDNRHIDGEAAEAILCSDRGVNEILAPFYQKTERFFTPEYLIDTFGRGVISVLDKQDKIPVTPQLLKTLWNFKDDGGFQMPFMIKIPGCDIIFPKSPTGIQIPHTADPRPGISGVTLQLLLPNGKKRQVFLEEGSFEGLFWSDRTVQEILAPFYNTVDRRLSRTSIIDSFGPNVTSIIGDRQEIRLTAELVSRLWNLKDEEGLLPSLFIKRPNCTYGIPRPQSAVEYTTLRKIA